MWRGEVFAISDCLVAFVSFYFQYGHGVVFAHAWGFAMRAHRCIDTISFYITAGPKQFSHLLGNHDQHSDTCNNLKCRCALLYFLIHVIQKLFQTFATNMQCISIILISDCRNLLLPTARGRNAISDVL